MGFFVARTRRVEDGPGTARELPEALRARLPRRFEAVGEALVSGSSATDPLEVAGRHLAEDGASLEEVLAWLEEAARLVARRRPSYDEVRAVSVAWSEATLAYLHQVSCEDPLTGLASPCHLRTRLTELYRAADRPLGLQPSHALVIVDLADDEPGQVEDVFAHTLRLVRAGEAARTVFPAAHTVGLVGRRRIAALVDKDEQLGRRIGILRSMLGLAPFPVRTWIEGLPPGDDGAAMLLDELARG